MLDTYEIRRQRLTEIRTRGFQTNAELARRLGSTAQQVGAQLNGTRRIGTNSARRIEEALGLERGFLDSAPTGESVMPIAAPAATSAPRPADYLEIPRLNVEGGPSMRPDFIESLCVRRPWLFSQPVATDTPQSLRLATAPGDEMSPTVNRGDIVLIDTDQSHIAANGIYALNNAGAVSLTRIQVAPDGRVTLQYDNSRYKSCDHIEASTINVIGRCLLAFNMKAL